MAMSSWMPCGGSRSSPNSSVFQRPVSAPQTKMLSRLFRKKGTFTLDDRSLASLPGRLPLMKLQWFIHYPMWPLIHLSWLIILADLWLIGLPLLLIAIGFVVVLALMFWYWKRVSEHFKHGCTLPAQVLAIEPTRVAVLTDMSKGKGKYPAIKITRIPLRRSLGRPVSVGDRICMVALYQADARPRLPHWKTFEPRPAEAANSDHDLIRKTMSRLPEYEWQELRHWIEMLPSHKPGLYRFHAPVRV